ncbi:MAG: hypothetical protein V3V08_01375 [Nannocystaceae bacterium]
MDTVATPASAPTETPAKRNVGSIRPGILAVPLTEAETEAGSDGHHQATRPGARVNPARTGGMAIFGLRRRHTQTPLGLPRLGRMGTLLPPPSGTTPAPVDTAMETLSPRSDGGYDFQDPHGRFSARIEPDGSVRFDVDNAIIRLCALTGCIDAKGGTSARRWTPNSAEIITTPEALTAQAVAGLQFMAPEVASPRITAEFLRRTFTLRLKMAHKWQRTQISRALGQLSGQLAKIWEDPTMSKQEKQRLIFELWLECAVAPAPPRDVRLGTVDTTRRKAAIIARTKIEASVRKYAPPQSPLAYSVRELENLDDQTRPGEHFRPYRTAR